MKECSGNGTSLSVGALWGEPGGKAPLLGTPKDTSSKALKMDASIGLPVREPGGGSFTGTFERQMKECSGNGASHINPYPTAFPYGNGMVLHFYQQQESSTTKTVHKVINKGLKAYV